VYQSLRTTNGRNDSYTLSSVEMRLTSYVESLAIFYSLH